MRNGIHIKIKEIFLDIEFINKLLLCISIVVLFLNYNRKAFFDEFSFVLIIPLLLLIFILLSDVFIIINKKLDIANKEDFNLIFNKFIYYFVIGFLHIIFNFYKIRDYNGDYQVLFFIYCLMLFLSFLFIVRFKIFNKVIKNLNQLKNTKYMYVFIIICIQILLNSELTQNKIKEYFKKGYDPSYYKINEIVPYYTN